MLGRDLHVQKSYLSDMVQSVDVNGRKSSGSVESTDIPQGLILCPFLCSVYISDLPKLMESIEHELVLFADDTH